MSLQTVLRLEYPATGMGPFLYMNGAARRHPEQPEMATCGRGAMPLHEIDKPGNDLSVFKFGFVNAQQANAWWDESARLAAAEAGYKLAVYEVPAHAVIADSAQCVFHPEVARLVAHIDPMEWVTGDLNMILQARLTNAADS